VNHRFENGALDSSRIPIAIFSFKRSISLGISALRTEIGFRFQGTCKIVKIIIGSTILKLAHPISFGEKAKAFLSFQHFLKFSFFF
jgi:hypothetical protein